MSEQLPELEVDDQFDDDPIEIDPADLEGDVAPFPGDDEDEGDQDDETVLPDGVDG